MTIFAGRQEVAKACRSASSRALARSLRARVQGSTVGRDGPERVRQPRAKGRLTRRSSPAIAVGVLNRVASSQYSQFLVGGIPTATAASAEATRACQSGAQLTAASVPNAGCSHHETDAAGGDSRPTKHMAQSALIVLEGPHAAARLVSQLKSDIRLAALYDHPLGLLVRGSAHVGNVVAVAAGTDDNIECALVAHLLVVPVANPRAEALSRLAQAAFSMQGAPTKVEGFQPHTGRFALLVPSPQPARQRQMAWLFSRERMMWSPDDPHAKAAASGVSLPAGVAVGVPESRADFEAMARIDSQYGLGNDPLMEEQGLEERVKEMADEAAKGTVTIAREPGGALVAMVQLSDLQKETDATVYVMSVGTLPSHARRGYAVGLLAHALLTKMKPASLMTFPGNEAASACYTKLGFVHVAESVCYQDQPADEAEAAARRAAAVQERIVAAIAARALAP